MTLYTHAVHATKFVARYNEVSRQFDAPTYAMSNIATLIKQCCSIALLQSSKMEATVQTDCCSSRFKNTIKINCKELEVWYFYQAADDLNVKKWNKITIVPLAAGLKLFKHYLCDISKQSSDNLTQSKEKTIVEAFDNLVESTYCRVLLLNRRRAGELQRLKLSDFNDYGNDGNKYKNLTKLFLRGKKY